MKPTSPNRGVLFAGPDSTFVSGNGTISNVAVISGGNLFSLNYTIPLQIWTELSLVGRGYATLLTVLSKGEQPRTTECKLATASIGVEAPVARVGEGFRGVIQDVKLTNSAL